MVTKKSLPSFSELNRAIVDCTRCTRLIDHCRNIARTKRRAYREDEYWGRPVPNLGSARAELLVVGLAPGAHGANRTGRMFSGDRSGDWLFRAMHRAGFANQPESQSADDGLKLTNAVITNICHCAPPDNKPNPLELESCQPFLIDTIRLIRPRVFLALGGLAWNAILKLAKEREWIEKTGKRPAFAHGHRVQLQLPNRRQPCWLVGSYHPSQQNTFTGRLTEPMFNSIFDEINRILKIGK